LRLADFRKVRLEPGETQELTFRLPVGQLAHWDVATGAFTVDPGSYEILVARSAGNVVLTAPLTVTGPAPAPRVVVGQRTPSVDFDDYVGVTLVDATRTTGDAILPADPAKSATLLFRSADLAGAVRVEAEIAREDGVPDVARLEFHVPGQRLAEIDVPVTGGPYSWTTVTADLEVPPTGVHELTVSVHGDFRLAAFRFSSPRSAD
jgi:beta-glucosidase